MRKTTERRTAGHRVMDGDTATALPGSASAQLGIESGAAEPTGLVPARYDERSRQWLYVQPSQAEQVRALGYEVRTVYVEE